LIFHHDALRMQFFKDENDKWAQINGSTNGNYYLFDEFTLPSDNEDLIKSSLIDHGSLLKSKLGFIKEPLIGVGLYHDKSMDGGFLLLCIHHLIIDLVSWRILFEDIENLLIQYRSGQKLHIQDKTDSYQYWMESQILHVEHGKVNGQSEYWQQQLKLPADLIPLINPNGCNNYGVSKSISFELTEFETSEVQRGMNGVNKIETNAFLLSAFSRALNLVFSNENTRILLEGHGRENSIESIDVSRTIGWFTSMYPFNLIHDEDNVYLALKTQNNLQQIVENGSGFGLLNYLSNETFYEFVKPQISFNYWGDFTIGEKENSKNQENRIFQLSNYEHGNDCHESLDLYADIDVSGRKKDGCIQMTIQFSPQRIDPIKIEELSQEFKRQIIALSEALIRFDKRIYYPNEFNYKNLSFDQLNELHHQIGPIDEILSLGPMQKGLYYHALQERDSCTYFVQISCELNGQLILDNFKSAFYELVNRHDALRTIFRNDIIEEPLQIIRKKCDVDFRFIDLSYLDD